MLPHLRAVFNCMTKYWLGKHRSEETKRKISLAKKGKSFGKGFWFYVKKTKTCWLWRGGIQQNTGYGQYTSKRKNQGAHRVSWILHFGEIPKGLFVLHKCDVKICVNPKHLFLGTQLDNMRDMHKKGRQPNLKGENCHHAKLNWKKVNQIRQLRIFKNLTYEKLARMFGISPGAILKIIKQKTWINASPRTNLTAAHTKFA